jgi:hypothetical protein
VVAWKTPYNVSMKHESKSEIVAALPVASASDLLVVCEFSGIFLVRYWNYPERAFKISIELVPGTAPISRRPYRMSLNELAELKVQLQELLDKGLTRSSSFLGRYPALLSKGKDKSLCMSVDYRPLSAVTDKTNIC